MVPSLNSTNSKSGAAVCRVLIMCLLSKDLLSWVRRASTIIGVYFQKTCLSGEESRYGLGRRVGRDACESTELQFAEPKRCCEDMLKEPGLSKEKKYLMHS